MNVTIFFDGGCLHKQRAAGAAVAYNEDGHILRKYASFMEGEHCTVNTAEYCGLLVGLQLAYQLGASHVRVLGDSELIVRQFNGIYQCRKDHLQPWLELVRERASWFESCVVEELPKAGKKNKRRHGNVVADALATKCMKAGRDLDERMAVPPQQ